VLRRVKAAITNAIQHKYLNPDSLLEVVPASKGIWRDTVMLTEHGMQRVGGIVPLLRGSDIAQRGFRSEVFALDGSGSEDDDANREAAQMAESAAGGQRGATAVGGANGEVEKL